MNLNPEMDLQLRRYKEKVIPLIKTLRLMSKKPDEVDSTKVSKLQVTLDDIADSFTRNNIGPAFYLLFEGQAIIHFLNGKFEQAMKFVNEAESIKGSSSTHLDYLKNEIDEQLLLEGKNTPDPAPSVQTYVPQENDIIYNEPEPIKKDLNMPTQYIIWGLCSLNGLYIAYFCLVILIAIFKYSVLLGLLLFIIGGLGVGLLFLPAVAAFYAAGLVILIANNVKGAFLRFLVVIFGLIAAYLVPYLLLNIIGSLVRIITT